MDGVPHDRNVGFILTVDEPQGPLPPKEGSLHQLFQRQWKELKQNKVLTSCCICTQPERKLVAISEDGFVATLGGGQIIDEVVKDGGRSPASRGPLVQISCLPDGRAYAVGTGRQAYVRDGSRKWRCIDETAQGGALPLEDTCFHSIGGFTAEEIYAVGWEGEIWFYDSHTWTPQSSPTNLAIYEVLCAPDGFVYACGQTGLILRGRRDQWTVLEQDETAEDFWGIASFNGRIFLSTNAFLYELQGTRLTQVAYAGIEMPKTCHKLGVSENCLWSVGAKDLLQFDGQNWQKLL